VTLPEPEHQVRTPEWHYVEADRLLAELAQTRAESFRFPFVQAKVQMAQIHAQLANSPWYPGDVIAAEEYGGSAVQFGPPIETRTATGDSL